MKEAHGPPRVAPVALRWAINEDFAGRRQAASPDIADASTHRGGNVCGAAFNKTTSPAYQLISSGLQISGATMKKGKPSQAGSHLSWSPERKGSRCWFSARKHGI